ncbi:hypothetical protein [Rubellicoccus peritrichatus]|uniref:Uncharacterized protein n=1 Tax=Rubellicoccus peritrichatus TaxID=3080537 RepID=A0AAQ3QX70_9BACT|nr:hypothetical protein [Puniceicoccus sp. CR14]WOO42585.1 hypothetical protein RZN69_05740 [Puniceicoccus sp. CR14]
MKRTITCLLIIIAQYGYAHSPVKLQSGLEEIKLKSLEYEALLSSLATIEFLSCMAIHKPDTIYLDMSSVETIETLEKGENLHYLVQLRLGDTITRKIEIKGKEILLFFTRSGPPVLSKKGKNEPRVVVRVFNFDGNLTQNKMDLEGDIFDVTRYRMTYRILQDGFSLISMVEFEPKTDSDVIRAELVGSEN